MSSPLLSLATMPVTATAQPHTERRIRQVAFRRRDDDTSGSGHDALTKAAVARRLADLLEAEFVGEDFPTDAAAAGGTLLVPADTLVGDTALPHAATPYTLFGGVVPQAFVGTKVITHPLLRPDAAAPQGWRHTFPESVACVVLPGWSVFDAQDARLAGRLLLQDGSVRAKAPQGVGGSGQSVIRTADELDTLIDAIDPALLRAEGLVLERNLRDVATYSVGQVRVGPYLASYCGTQRLVTNHAGEQVYGGSQLTVVRGDYDRLLRLPIASAQRVSVEQARRYHAQALVCFPGLAATRSNYDVAQGRDDAGHFHSGVLEQSWRIGGASGAEVLALHALRNDPSLDAVEAATVEVYGEPDALPEDACVYYDGVDPRVGRLVKYGWARPYGHA